MLESVIGIRARPCWLQTTESLNQFFLKLPPQSLILGGGLFFPITYITSHAFMAEYWKGNDFCLKCERTPCSVRLNHHLLSSWVHSAYESRPMEIQCTGGIQTCKNAKSQILPVRGKCYLSLGGFCTCYPSPQRTLTKDIYLVKWNQVHPITLCPVRFCSFGKTEMISFIKVSEAH